MGWSYRKSFGSGPFRVNFSKSGISYSVGVKGARVNIGPRGTYVNLSSHGISYRRRIDGTHERYNTPSTQTLSSYIETPHNIASASIMQLTDTDSKDFVSELTEKSRQVSYVGWFGVFPLVIFLVVLAFTSFSSITITTRAASDSALVKITSEVGAYIRKSPYAKSVIVKTALADQTFLLADSTNSKWLKVNFNDSTGYVNRRFAMIDHVHHDADTADRTSLADPYAGYLLVIGLVGFVLLIRWLKKVDRKRFEMELNYEMDDQFKQVYEQFGQHFATFSASARIWQYLNSQQTSDFKRNAGAGQLIKRTSARVVSSNQAPLPYFITNVAIPCLKLSNLEFYFFPERLLVKQGRTFAGVFYKNLHITGYVSRFIEDEAVPRDAAVVDRTWRYVNKHGGPDRRFNNNRQIPICAYSQYTLKSDTGIYEVITTSKQGAMDGFADFLAQIGSLQSKMTVD